MLNHFRLARYGLILQAVEPLSLPPFKGSVLRGGFGHIFKRLVCFQPRRCLQHCQLGNTCPYGYIFETAPPDDSEILRTFNEVPRPFLIEPPFDQRTSIKPGEQLTFHLTLIGRGINYLPYFVAVFRELGRVGLGRGRGKYNLLAVEAFSRDLGITKPMYRMEDEQISTDSPVIDGQVITARAATWPLDHLILDFLTPTRLKHQGQWITEGPSFQALIKVLLGRISSLSYFHCGQKFEADFRGLIDRAAGVQIVECKTHWEDWSRFSGRQQQEVEMGGLVGRVSYAGELQPYLPLLALGEWVHVGKGTVFGNGQYRLTGEYGP